MNNLTPKEERTLLSLLSKLEPGYYPFEVFLQFCRLATHIAVEVIPFIKKDDHIEVVMIKRPKDDRFWPDMWHTTGCILRPKDNIEDALNRVITDELGNPRVKLGPKYFDFGHGHGVRGSSLYLLHWIEVENIPLGKSFEIDKWPKNTVNGQREHFVQRALDDYLKST